MSITVPIKSIDLRQGSAIAIHPLSWHECEDILNELGEDRHTRIAYYAGILEIMSPLTRHERLHRIAGYIINAAAVRDCQGRVDVGQYPPPDLAIESDVTSKTLLSAYEAIAVPEIWIYRDRSLKIFLLTNGHYLESKSSLFFPDFSISTLVPKLIDQAIAIGTSVMLREFRQSLLDRAME